MWKNFIDWLDERIALRNIIQAQILDYRLPKNINIFHTLGFLALIAFSVEALTGIILMVYYVPHPDHAFRSVQEIMNIVPYGWLFRQMHAVGSNLLITVLFLHMITVFMMGNYKRPRELTWLSGSLSLVTIIMFGFSGYLLPWTQLSYWSTTVVTAVPTAFPVVGDFVMHLLRGSEHVTDITLIRFFALHVAILPAIFLALAALHLFLVNRIGISSTPFGMIVPEKSPRTDLYPTIYLRKNHADGYPYYPYFFRKQMYTMMAFFAVMFFIITFFPNLFFSGDANIPADPFRTPSQIRPEWYLLAPYQFLKLIPNKLLGIALQLSLIAIFLFWPFLDTQEEKNVMKRPILRGVFLFLIALWIILLLWGRS